MALRSVNFIPILLAGGCGTRISHLTGDIPKPAIPIFGKPFIGWVLSQLAAFGFKKVVISSGYRALELYGKVQSFVPAQLEVSWVVENLPLGTGGGAVWAAHCSGWRPGDWLVMNGDSYLAGSWPKKICRLQSAGLVARELEDTGRFGRLEEKAGRLVRFLEKTGAGPGLINAGIYRIPRGWLEEIPPGSAASMETELFPGWLREGREIRILRESGAFLDIGTPESLAGADMFARRHFAPQ